MLVSAEHERRGVKHDASSVWVEDVTTTSFKICIRELQNFDGAHQSIHVVSNFQLFIFVDTSRIVSVSNIYSTREIIYQTRETVFHRDIQTPRRECVWIAMKQCLECLISSRSKQKLRSKWRSKMVKIYAN